MTNVRYLCMGCRVKASTSHFEFTEGANLIEVHLCDDCSTSRRFHQLPWQDVRKALLTEFVTEFGTAHAQQSPN